MAKRKLSIVLYSLGYCEPQTIRSQTELHRHYCHWCQLSRRHALGLHTFGDALRNAFSWAGLSEDMETHKIFGVHPLELPQ